MRYKYHFVDEEGNFIRAWIIKAKVNQQLPHTESGMIIQIDNKLYTINSIDHIFDDIFDTMIIRHTCSHT